VGELFQGRIDPVTRALDPASFDPDLRAEHSRDANLSVSRGFGNLALTTSLIYQDIDDAIFRFAGLSPVGTLTTSYKNVDRVRMAGAELIIDATDVFVDGLDFNLGVARLDSSIERNAANVATEDERFAGIPDWRVNGTLQYRMGGHFSASVGWRYGSQPYSDLSGRRGDAYGFLSEYRLVDARLTWRPTDLIEASLGVDNIGNEQAYIVSPLAQRTGYAEVRLRF
jgi:iron complex outermembrane recepter protein